MGLFHNCRDATIKACLQSVAGEMMFNVHFCAVSSGAVSDRIMLSKGHYCIKENHHYRTKH